MKMHDSTTRLINGIDIPRFLYGTAWKEDRTQFLVELALDTGFHGIDTANQRKHYHEAAVGQAIATAIAKGVVNRDDLFLQTKFTFRNGQDQRLPYDQTAPVVTQVEQSFASSLEHLGVERLDSYVLHGPSQRSGLGTDDWAAWRAMELLHGRGDVRFLGISNVSLDQLQQLCDKAKVRPTFVQNRCYASLEWDRAVRDYCAAHQIIYQGFSLLTANRDVLMDPEIRRIASHYLRTPCQIVFRFALQVGMLPLTGTSNREHMQQDLAAFEFELTPDEIELIERLNS